MRRYHLEDFTFHDFISNLGGFIGIFLGYSLLQIPQLLGIFITRLANFSSGICVYSKKYLKPNRIKHRSTAFGGYVEGVRKTNTIGSKGTGKIEDEEIRREIHKIITEMKQDIEKSMKIKDTKIASEQHKIRRRVERLEDNIKYHSFV